MRRNTREREDAAALIAARDIRSVALAKRAEQVGAANALSRRAETPLGRARILGIITEGQYRAGVQLEALVTLWRMAHGVPLGRTPSLAGALFGGGGAGRELDADDVRVVNARYNRAYRVLSAIGHRAHAVTVGIVMRAEPVTDENLADLRIGLGALSNHFNKGGRGDHRNRVLEFSEDGEAEIDGRFWTRHGDSPDGGREGM